MNTPPNTDSVATETCEPAQGKWGSRGGRGRGKSEVIEQETCSCATCKHVRVLFQGTPALVGAAETRDLLSKRSGALSRTSTDHRASGRHQRGNRESGDLAPATQNLHIHNVSMAQNT